MSPKANTVDVTRLLRESGSPIAAAQLIPLVFEELRAIASRRLRRERPDHTLQPTALVNEVYLRLFGGKSAAAIPWANRAHFFGVAADTMRKLLLEHARNRNRQKRVGSRKRISLTVVDVVADDTNSADIESIELAIGKLDEQDPRLAQIVKLRFFAGLGTEQVADVLEISPSTVRRDWRLARAWLARELGSDPVDPIKTASPPE